MEETYVMIKPDGVEKNILGDVIEIFNNNGLEVSNIKAMMLDEEKVCEHYSHLVDKDFFPHLKEFMLSGLVIGMKVSGENAVMKVRSLIGATNPVNAEVGTIREMYGDKVDTTRNAIHASDSVENAQIEFERFGFNEKTKTLKWNYYGFTNQK